MNIGRHRERGGERERAGGGGARGEREPGGERIREKVMVRE